jgi:hypothetical protein
VDLVTSTALSSETAASEGTRESSGEKSGESLQSFQTPSLKLIL